VDAFVRNAEEILETACRAEARGASEYLIAISQAGCIRMISETTAWSLPALATEYAASAVYRVMRRGSSVRVEGWSAGRSCVLNRELPRMAWQLPTAYGGVTLLNAA